MEASVLQCKTEDRQGICGFFSSTMSFIRNSQIIQSLTRLWHLFWHLLFTAQSSQKVNLYYFLASELVLLLVPCDWQVTSHLRTITPCPLYPRLCLKFAINWMSVSLGLQVYVLKTHFKTWLSLGNMVCLGHFSLIISGYCSYFKTQGKCSVFVIF